MHGVDRSFETQRRGEAGRYPIENADTCTMWFDDRYSGSCSGHRKAQSVDTVRA